MSHHIKRSIASASALMTVLAIGVPAFAGTLQVRDDANLLTPAEESALQQQASRWPFDARVLTDSRFASREAFDRHIGSLVSSSQMVVVGIDPTHHWSSVHFGTATRIPTTRFSAIENAGDPYFRGSQWGGGIQAILNAASTSGGSALAADTSEAPGFPWRMILFGALAIAGVALAVRYFRRRNTGSPYMPGAYNQPGVQPGMGMGPQPGYNAPYGGYNQYGPSGPMPGSSIGTGIAGAALGGLAGYALGNAMANHGEPSAGHADTIGAGPSPGESVDAGGSSSGWDDGGGGGGGDFGGGGDGGGGGDW